MDTPPLWFHILYLTSITNRSSIQHWYIVDREYITVITCLFKWRAKEKIFLSRLLVKIQFYMCDPEWRNRPQTRVKISDPVSGGQ